MGFSIAVTSGKGGVGKSSICIGLGVALAQAGFQVCLIDMDLGLKNLDVMMGLENRVFYDLMDVMEQRCSLNKAIIKDKHQQNLSLLPACKTMQTSQFNGDKFIRIVNELKNQFDYILMDTPAGIESGFLHAMHCADRMIVVTTLDVTALQDADRIIGLLMKENADKIQLIVNRCNPRYIEKGISVRLEEALNWLSIELLGIVYDEEMIVKGHNKGTPYVMDKSSLTHECFKQIVATFLGEPIQIPKYRTKGFLQKFFMT